jgi:hypothetical protein
MGQERTLAERVEEVRLAWERELEAELLRMPRHARPPLPDPRARDRWVFLEESMAARVHRVAREAADRIGCTEPLVLWLTPTLDEHVNAQALIRGPEIEIRLIGPVARLLDDAALRALVGHEIGHHLAHGPRATPPSIIFEAYERGAPAECWRFCNVATELTADRMALLACRELEAAVRLEIASETLDQPAALGVREREYLETVRARIENGKGACFNADTHPSRDFRVFASWLFWQSDLFRELTGEGCGTLPIRGIDARLRALCEAASTGEPVVRPLPPPSLPPAIRGSSQARSVLPASQVRPCPWPRSLEGLAVDVLTDGARRRLSATGKAIVKASRAVDESLDRIAEVAAALARGRGGPSSNDDQ